MKITVEINVGDNPPTGLLAQLLSSAAALDQPLILRKTQVGDLSLTEYPAGGNSTVQQVFREVTGAEQSASSYHQMAEQAEGDGEGDGSSEGSDGDAGEQQTQAPGAAPKKRGRRSNAEIAAAKAAAEASAASMVAGAVASLTLPPGVTQLHPQLQQTPNVPQAGGLTLPPGVTMAQTPTPTPAPVPTPTPAHTPTAMPAVPPGTEPLGSGGISLEHFKEAYLQINTQLPGKPFAVLKATTWPDGTPKAGWFTAEAVPPEHRERLLEAWSLLT